MPKRISAAFLQSVTALLLVALVIGVCYAKFPAYLSNYRVIQGVGPYQQNYVVLDDQILSNSRHDLGDLRVFADFQEIPFELVTERGDDSRERTEAKILSKERVGSETQFVLDVTGLPQCDQVDLSLADSARDFVSEAQVEGLRSPTERVGVNLGSSILFDLSSEGLGSGSTVKFAMTRDPYLRVRLTKLAPDQVLQAVPINSRLGNPSWTALGGELPVRQEGRTTVVTWDASVETPVMRLAFKVDPAQTNFWRDVQVLTLGGGTITNRSVRRIHLVRDGKLAQSEWLDFTLPSERWGAFKLVFQNGDEQPLKITSARAYAYERRVYFYPKGRSNLALFYGNSTLVAPDYVHLQPLTNMGEADAVATLGPDMRNPERVPGALEIRPFPGQLAGGAQPQTISNISSAFQEQCTFSDGSTITFGHKALGETAQGEDTWHTGDYQATTFAVSETMRMQRDGVGFDIPAGTYTLYVDPTKSGSWPLIFSKSSKWGADYPGEQYDLGRTLMGYDLLNPPRQDFVIGCLERNNSPMFIWMESGNRVGYAKLMAEPIASDGTKRMLFN